MSEPDPQEYPTDFDLIICDEVDSTSDALRRLLVEKSESEGAYPARLIPAVMALRQTKGRGRLGRFWASPPGGLYVSVALDTTEASCGEPALSLIVALALRTMLAEYLQQEQTRAQGARSNPQDIQVKWPNDITCSEGKIAGILVESVPLASKRRVAIVGVGINVTQPTDTASPSAASRNSIAQTAGNSTTSPVSAVSPDQAASHNTVAQAPHDPAAYLSQFSSPVPELRWLAEQALNSILASYRIWQAAGYRFAPFRQDYESCLALRNVDTVVSNSRGDVLAEGAIRGVDDDGRLLLEDASGSLVRISTGEVTLRRERA